MIPGARLILLGRQGAGKGTQCVRLSRHFVVPHISTGDMLRAAVREGTELGVMAKQVMDQGGLVGDEIMVGIVRERLSQPDAVGRGYILDGFPRTVPQAEALDEITADAAASTSVLDLDVPRELVLERLSARRVCRDCGTNYVAAGVGEAAVDLRGLRRRRDAPRRRHARGDQPSARPLRAADVAADRVLQRAGPARRHRRRGHRPTKCSGGSPPRSTRPAARADGPLRPRRHPPAHAGGAAPHACRRPGGGRDARGRARRGRSPVSPPRRSTGVARDVIERRDATSNFFGYHGFPAVICTSVNDEVVHGIPGGRVLEDGDLLSVDCGAIVNGWHGDAAFTMGIGTITAEAQRLIDTADAALAAAIAQMRPGRHLGDVGHAIETVVAHAGYGSPRDFCGHGIGRAMHEDPDVENRGRPGRGPELHDRRGAGHRADADRRRPRRRARSSTTAGPWSPPTARWPRTPSTPCSSATHGPEILTRA